MIKKRNKSLKVLRRLRYICLSSLGGQWLQHDYWIESLWFKCNKYRILCWTTERRTRYGTVISQPTWRPRLPTTNRPGYCAPRYLDLLVIPRTKTVTASEAFRIAAPKVWNSLPPTVRSSDSITGFRRRLKTHLFDLAYNWTQPVSFSAPLTRCPRLLRFRRQLNYGALEILLIDWLIDWLINKLVITCI